MGDTPIIRQYPIPKSAKRLSLLNDYSELRAHRSYRQSKAGNHNAAFKMLMELVGDQLIDSQGYFPANAVYASPFAREVAGDNALPIVLALFCAAVFEGEPDLTIVQKERVYHTGANPMERLITRPSFVGQVKSGRNYVLVDDVINMGNTLAELANYIISGGGDVIGYCVIVDDGRLITLSPEKKIIDKLSARFGDEIEEIFGIRTDCLTANESQYLLGFRTTDEIRNRCLKAKKEIDLRRASKKSRESFR